MPFDKRNDSKDYYSDYDDDTPKDNNQEEFPIKKIFTGLLILLVLIIVLILTVNLLSQKNNLLFFSGDGSSFKQTVTISKDGTVIDSAAADGNVLTLSGNPLDSIKGKITSSALAGGNKTGKITIKGSGGKITVLNSGEGFYIDENGTVVFTVDPSDFIDLEEYYDENSDSYNFPEDFNYETVFEFVITDEETGEDIIIIAPVDFVFASTNTNGCMSLNRSFVNESTHYGYLSTLTNLELSCDSITNLTSSVTWDSDRMGNVELVLGAYNYASVLTDYNKAILSTPVQGEYPFTIIFTPFEEAAGKKAYFSVNFNLNGVTSKIDFEVPIDNLEQCVQITPSDDLKLSKESDSVSFKVDVSTCYSDRIAISLCDNDSGCSGGTEGGINLSEYSFSLSPRGNSSRIVNISKDEIPGAYGIPVYARVSGASKVLVDEKTVIVEPFNGETVFPEKYTVSVIGTGKDSITIRNNDLAEDVEVTTNICNLYKSSMGANTGTSIASYSQSLFGKSWLASLASDSDRYAGAGKYQAGIVNTFGTLESERIRTQSVSSEKNSYIKKAYTLTKDTVDKINTAYNDTSGMLDDLKNLDDKIKATEDYADLDLTSQIVSLGTGISSIYTSVTFLAADLSATATATTAAATSAAKCPFPAGDGTVGSQMALASGATAKAAAEGSTLVAYSTASLALAAAAYGAYSGVTDLTGDVEEVNAKSALNNTKTALDKLDSARAESLVALKYAELMMISASIDSFYSVSKDDFDAKTHANELLDHAQNVLDLLAEVIEYLTKASDDLTIGLPETQSNTEQIIQVAASLAGLLVQMPGLESSTTAVMSQMDLALTKATLSAGAATAACGSPDITGTTKTLCCDAAATGNAAVSKISSTNLTGLATLTSVTQYVSLLNSAYNLLRIYQTMTDNYAEDYTNSMTKLSNVIPSVNNAKIAAQSLIDLLPTTISAADWLGNESEKTSDAATFESAEYGIDEEYNKERLNGIIGSVLANGFVNGAYEGGVYSEESNFSLSKANGDSAEQTAGTKANFADESDWKEDCKNEVTLKLVDYKINLLKDAQTPSLSTNGIVAYWDFSDPKVYGVFEEQTADIVFANTGITKNTYGVISIPLTKHIHENPTETTATFGPFDVPDESESITYKYHLKINTIVKKSNNYVKPTGENSCSMGIIRGKTGNVESLPRIILSWDWNSVVPADYTQINKTSYSRKLYSAVVGTNSESEPFLDATQLSILISKKLGSLEYYLERAQTECPENPAGEVLEQIEPNIVTEGQTNYSYTSESDSQTVSQKCYLPLSTEEYDGKPALYYYLPQSSVASDIISTSDIDIKPVTTREEFLPLVDFNVYLIRDGYGIDFQSDFVTSISAKFFDSSYSFMNDQSGMKTYFYNSDRFFFSSKANANVSKKEWALPDAGKYRVRALIDFDDTARLFTSSSPSAQIIIMLDLIEPVSSNYSPLYYTPIDGFTGLTANNNRRGYGSSISGGYNLDVIQSQGVMLSTEQKNALQNIKLTKSSDFFLLNALPSMRAKILDYSISPTLGTDSSIIFTPTTATPLLFEIKETQGERALLNYSVKKDNLKLSTSLNSLFILSKLEGCYDYTGKTDSTFTNNGPDFGNGEIFGLYLPNSEKTGLNYIKTVAYSPLQNNYYLEKPLAASIYSPLYPFASGNDTLLDGVVGMKSNSASTSETVSSLQAIMQGVEAGSICVADFGTREVFFWPEGEMFDERFVNDEFTQKLENAKNICIK